MHLAWHFLMMYEIKIFCSIFKSNALTSNQMGYYSRCGRCVINLMVISRLVSTNFTGLWSIDWFCIFNADYTHVFFSTIYCWLNRTIARSTNLTFNNEKVDYWHLKYHTEFKSYSYTVPNGIQQLQTFQILLGKAERALWFSLRDQCLRVVIILFSIRS